jgi:ElaB/YqjD/DUF883 family membrane-anchored ribosome-binding protein
MEVEQSKTAHSAVSEAERALQSATERLAQAAHQAVDSLSTYGERAEERVRDTADVATEKSRELIYQVRNYVEEHPLAAIGIAAAVGFACGMLMRSSDSSGRSNEAP